MRLLKIKRKYLEGLGASAWVSLILFGLCAATSVPAQADVGGLSTDWVLGHGHRVRLVAGRQTGAVEAGQGGIVAGIEIELDDGWKTYWRNPGEAGGVPPEFDFSKSHNVASAKVLYPAPKRLTDATGDTIGYKHSVIFPVLITAATPSDDVDLKLDFAFGVCSDICVPAEASLSLSVPGSVSERVPDEVAEALEHVPRGKKMRRAGDPKLISFDVDFKSKAPHIVMDVAFPGGSDKGDLFVTAPDGIYVPMAKKVKTDGLPDKAARFEVDLREAFDLEELKGLTVTLTMVGAEGQSQGEIVLK